VSPLVKLVVGGEEHDAAVEFPDPGCAAGVLNDQFIVLSRIADQWISVLTRSPKKSGQVFKIIVIDEPMLIS
jgi:hypothetical protein